MFYYEDALLAFLLIEFDQSTLFQKPGFLFSSSFSICEGLSAAPPDVTRSLMDVSAINAFPASFAVVP